MSHKVWFYYIKTSLVAKEAQACGQKANFILFIQVQLGLFFMLETCLNLLLVQLCKIKKVPYLLY